MMATVSVRQVVAFSKASAGITARPQARAVAKKPLPVALRQNRASTITNVVGRSETAEQATARRMRESEEVADRVVHVTTVAELEEQISAAGDKLLVIEVASDELCQLDSEHSLSPAECAKMKHSFQRTARDCPDAMFLEVLVDGDDHDELLDTLGVDVLPTVQFVKSGKLLYQHVGISQLDQDVSEGVLFYGDAGAGGMHPSEYVTEISSKADLHAWKASLDAKVLGVLDISTTNAPACMHIFPTVVVLARQFKGFASFARLIGDTNAETKALLKELDVTTVPTFKFYRGGEIAGQHVGSSRSDLISAILTKQAELGLTPPPPEEGRRARAKHAAEDRKANKPKVKKRWNTIF